MFVVFGSARGAMSVAAGSATLDRKAYEDSTDSDNETERKALLRRISTSKCVGRLVSTPALFYLAYTCMGVPAARGAGSHVPGRER